MITQGELIQAALRAAAPMSLTEIVEEEIKRWQGGRRLDWMRDGQRYYRGEHDVLRRGREVIGRDGRRIPAVNLADNRIAHAFLTELVDQKIQYLLGKPYSLQGEEPGYLEALDGILKDNRFTTLLGRVARDAVNQGVGWLQVYYDPAGALRFAAVDPKEVIPLWRDAAHDALDGVIRVVPLEAYEGRERRFMEQVELWSAQGVARFTRKDGKLTPQGQAPHFTATLPGKRQGLNWDRPPFIPVKYNQEELPLLHRVKGLVDEYDRTVSGEANLLEDQPNAVYVIHNYDGTDLGEFRVNLTRYRAVKVADGGDVTALTTPVNVQASGQHLERLRRDIYAFGRGVDTRNERLRGNTSGQALKYEYAQLDLDCNGLEKELESALDLLQWFVQRHLENSGQGRYTKPAQFVFNRDVIVNEAEAIAMCQSSEGIVSRKTILANHPWVQNVAEEQARLQAEQSGLDAGRAQQNGSSGGRALRDGNGADKERSGGA